MADQQIIIDIVTRLDKLEKDLQRAGQKTDKFGQRIKKLGVIFAGITAGVFALTKGIGSLIKAYAKQEKEEKLLARAIQNRVSSLEEAGAATEQLIKFAKERQAVTAFGDEATLAAMKIGATFPLTVDQIKELTIRAQDYASATGKDLTAAMADLGRATEGQYGMLSRYGVSIRDVTKETGDFNMLLQDLDSNFGGFAETMATTVEGRWKQLGNLIGDAKERLGKALLPAMEKLYGFLSKLPDMIDAIAPTVAKVVEALVDVLDAMWPLVEDLLPAIAPLLDGIAASIKFLAGLLRPLTQTLGQAIKDLKWLLSAGAKSTEERQIQAVRTAVRSRLTATEYMMLGKELGLNWRNRADAQKWLEEMEQGGYGGMYGQSIEELAAGGMIGPYGEAEGVTGGGGGLPPGKGGTGTGKKSNIIRVGPYAGFTVEDAMFFHDEQMGMLDDINKRMLDADNAYTQFKETVIPMTEKEIEAERNRQEEIKKTEAAYVSFAQSVKSQFDQVFGQPLTQLFDDTFGRLKFQIEETDNAFSKFFKGIINNLIDLIGQLAVQGLAFAAIITGLNAIPPPGTIGTAFAKFLAGMSSGSAGKDVMGGNIGGLIGKLFSGGYDSPINDTWARRQGTDFAREFALGLQRQMMPAGAGFGGVQIIEVPAGMMPFINVYRNSPEAERQASGRVFREATAISKRGEI